MSKTKKRRSSRTKSQVPVVQTDNDSPVYEVEETEPVTANAVGKRRWLPIAGFIAILIVGGLSLAWYGYGKNDYIEATLSQLRNQLGQEGPLEAQWDDEITKLQEEIAALQDKRAQLLREEAALKLQIEQLQRQINSQE